MMSKFLRPKKKQKTKQIIIKKNKEMYKYYFLIYKKN